MKPAWDKLGSAYQGSSSVVIGDVDCTAGGEKVCSDNGVQGYPTIKYFTAETGKKGEDYSGGRDFDSLDKFVKETLAKKCDVVTKADCDDKEKAYIEKQSAKGSDAQKAEAKRLEGMKNADMTDDKRTWINKRIAILNDLVGGSSKGEL
jgi:protein disulfide-isomerase A6